MAFRLLIINPGSTSTKIGVFEDEKELFEETLRHTNEELKQYDTINLVIVAYCFFRYFQVIK